MTKKWYQLSEQGAGTKRLVLTKYLYQIFGEPLLRIIAFFVALSIFIKSKERREASKKFMRIMDKKFVTISAFIQFLNYANSLVDKILSCMGKLDPNLFDLDSPEAYNGAFFVTTHIGNVEILRSLFQSDKFPNPKRVNVFLQSNACEIFNNFLKALEIKLNIEVFPVEEINPQTSIETSERLKDGEIVFLAGDRVSAQNENKVYDAEILGRKVQFPLGTLKFAMMMNVPIYFVVCAKEGKRYKVFTQKFESNSEKKSVRLEELKKSYVSFVETYTQKYPYQFYHFYEIFK